MAGRGRGRGRGLSINIEALGIGRGEVIPSVAQPPPLYPPLLFQGGLPAQNADLDYMVALRQELRYSLHKSPYYINAPNKTKDIERYSDKYTAGTSDGTQRWEPDWNMFPTELQERKKRKVKAASVKPNLKAARKDVTKNVSELLEKLEKVAEATDLAEDAQNENEDDETVIKKEKNEDDNADEDEDEEYDEEDLEEETDYNLAYFDNGEGYGDDDEDDDEGPTY